MALEIERKFLVVSDSWRAQVKRSAHMRQGYLASERGCSVRVRIADDGAWLSVKSATAGLQRLEFEYQIPTVDADEMLDEFCVHHVVEKTRYFVDHERHTWEIDEFEADNAGLTVAEIELRSAGEAFAQPQWLGVEVSQDERYYNSNLSRHPYKDW